MATGIVTQNEWQRQSAEARAAAAEAQKRAESATRAARRATWWAPTGRAIVSNSAPNPTSGPLTISAIAPTRRTPSSAWSIYKSGSAAKNAPSVSSTKPKAHAAKRRQHACTKDRSIR